MYCLLGKPSDKIIEHSIFLKNLFDSNKKLTYYISENIKSVMDNHNCNLNTRCFSMTLSTLLIELLTWDTNKRIKIEESLKLFKNV